MNPEDLNVDPFFAREGAQRCLIRRSLVRVVRPTRANPRVSALFAPFGAPVRACSAAPGDRSRTSPWSGRAKDAAPAPALAPAKGTVESGSPAPPVNFWRGTS